MCYHQSVRRSAAKTAEPRRRPRLRLPLTLSDPRDPVQLWTVDTVEALFTGAGLGLAAGLSPGPLLVLVISASLERGFAGGARVAMAPLVTDVPIVAASLAAASTLPARALTGLTVAGGLFIVHLGVGTVRRAGNPQATASRAAGRQAASGDLWRGALVNVLSPHPWLFWLGIGGPLVTLLWRQSGGPAAAVFLALFYGALVGSKLLLAALLARGRHALGGHAHRRVISACGLLLVGLGLWLVASGGLDVLLAA